MVLLITPEGRSLVGVMESRLGIGATAVKPKLSIFRAELLGAGTWESQLGIT